MLRKQSERLHKIPCPVIAVTGSLASGKTFVLETIKRRGECAFSADAIVSQIYQMPETIHYIGELVPKAVKKGVVDKHILREQFYSSTELKHTIEAFIYKRIPAKIHELLGKDKIPTRIFYEVPLLFEKNLQKQVDLIVCVWAKRSVRKSRFVEREAQKSAEMEKEELEKLFDSIEAHQIDAEKKRQRSDWVIDTEQSTSAIEASITDLLKVRPPLG